MAALYCPLYVMKTHTHTHRQSFVQPVLELAAEAGAAEFQLGSVEKSPVQEAVVLRTFPGTLAGAVDSFVYRFPQVDDAALQLWRQDAKHHVL